MTREYGEKIRPATGMPSFKAQSFMERSTYIHYCPGEMAGTKAIAMSSGFGLDFQELDSLEPALELFQVQMS